jgi:hypothetical protein
VSDCKKTIRFLLIAFAEVPAENSGFQQAYAASYGARSLDFVGLAFACERSKSFLFRPCLPSVSGGA